MHFRSSSSAVKHNALLDPIEAQPYLVHPREHLDLLHRQTGEGVQALFYLGVLHAQEKLQPREQTNKYFHAQRRWMNGRAQMKSQRNKQKEILASVLTVLYSVIT